MKLPDLNSNRVLCLLSGGADSVVAAFSLHHVGYQVCGVIFNYGQSAYQAELHCAKQLMKRIHRGGYLRTVDLRRILFPMTHGAKSNDLAYVPLRNTVFMVVAGAKAVEMGAGGICIGYMKQDTAFYDNSVNHHHQIEDLLSRSLEAPMRVHLPLIEFDKTDVMRYVDLHQLETVSCWNAVLEKSGVVSICGECANCIERAEAESNVRKRV